MRSTAALLIIALIVIAVIAYVANSRKRVALPIITDDRTISDVFRAFANTPIELSIGPVTSKLVSTDVLVVTSEEFKGMPGEKLKMGVSRDQNGDQWAYCYTDEERLLVTNPPGTFYSRMSFTGFFRMITRDPQFRGVYIDGGSPDSFVVPREFFELVPMVGR
jgi:SseB protein N-terminal domain